VLEPCCLDSVPVSHVSEPILTVTIFLELCLNFLISDCLNFLVIGKVKSVRDCWSDGD
jgi:hypothetical protein